MAPGVEVAATSDLPGTALDELASRYNLRVHRGDALKDENLLAGFIGNAVGVVTLLENPVTESVLKACPRLRVVANCAVGYDNIDLEAARRHNTWVTNTPDVLTEATADLTWALILALTRRVVESDAFLRQGRYRGWAPDLLLGSGLQGRTLGIVGLGRIGSAVARRALAFGMEVAYTDRRLKKNPGTARAMELDDLLSVSHVVSLHCPLTAETRHLLDRCRLGLMQRGAFVVNTARGLLIDEVALVDALESQHLGGAGLDVFEHEPEIHPGLLHRSDTVLLPHIGSATRETRAAMAGLAVANVMAILDEREPPTPVVRGR